MEINKRFRNGLFIAGLAGVGGFLLSVLFIALLVPPGGDLVKAWMLTADVHLAEIIALNIVGFIIGYRRNRAGPTQSQG